MEKEKIRELEDLVDFLRDKIESLKDIIHDLKLGLTNQELKFFEKLYDERYNYLEPDLEKDILIQQLELQILDLKDRMYDGLD